MMEKKKKRNREWEELTITEITNNGWKKEGLVFPLVDKAGEGTAFEWAFHFLSSLSRWVSRARVRLKPSYATVYNQRSAMTVDKG